MLQSDHKDLELVIKSHIPLIIAETNEERRVINMLTDLGFRLGLPLYQWSVTEGLSRLEFESPAMGNLKEPQELLKHIKANTVASIYVLPDFHPYLEDPVSVRLLKEIALNYEKTPSTLIFVSHDFDVPPEIKMFTAHFELALPSAPKLEDIIREEAMKWSEKNQYKKVKTDQKSMDQMIRNLSGLTAMDARRVIRRAIENDGAINEDDMPEVMEAKYKLLDRDGALTFEHDTAKFTEVGGLRNLKRWLKLRKDVFLGEDNSLEPPKGVLLVGVQGGGKSLAAKAIAGMWGLPLLRLDMGGLYNKYIGETEKNLRDAIKTAEVMSPCVLWIDEIEKAISGGGGDSDNGTSRRMLGTILTWMSEKDNSIFIVSTANEIDRLPPELIRKGRMDEIFFVDLPVAEVREDIFEIHLKKRDLVPGDFNLKELAASCEGFTGAEIEQAVVSGLYLAKEKGETLDNSHLLEEIKLTRPLSVVMAEKMAYLRQWASDRTVNADIG